MGDWRKEWFTFDRKDRIAIPVLILLIISLSFLFFHLNRFYDSKMEAKRIDDLKMALVDNESNRKDSSYNNEYSKQKKNNNNQSKDKGDTKIKVQLFKFNPNTISHDSIVLLGFSSKEAHAFLNFRNSGAQFFKPEDIQKSFVITQSDYERLKDYIEIPNRTHSKQYQSKDQSSYKDKSIVIEINSASLDELQKIRGVGPSFANRISKYRDLLGGYISKEQLLEVYGIDEGKFNEISSQIVIEPSKVKKLNVNSLDVKTLSSHPYIDYSVAKSIVAYRKQHGKYLKKEDLKNLHLITDKIFDKIKLYISIQ